MTLKVALISVNVPGYYSQAIRTLKQYAEARPALAGRVDIRLFEAHRYRSEVTALVARVAAFAPDVVGASCNVWNVGHTFAAAAQLRARLPRALIVVGGQEVTCSHIDYAAQHPEVDLLVDGEGEACFAAILERLSAWPKSGDRMPGVLSPCADRRPMPSPDFPAGSDRFDALPGIWRLRDGRSVRSGMAELVQDLDDIPSPVLAGLVDHTREDRLGVMVEGTRGCPCRCRFCFEGTRFKSARSFSVERVAREIRFMRDRGARYFHIMDPILCNADTRRLRDLHAALLDHGVEPGRQRIGVEAYAERLRPEHLPYLAHITMFDLGLQTIMPEVGRNILRPVDLVRFEAGTRLLQAAGKEVNIYLIFGLPGETLATFREGIRYAVSLRPTRLFLNHLCLLNGTGLRDVAEEFGIRADAEAPYLVRETSTMNVLEMQQARALSHALMRQYNTWGPSLNPQGLLPGLTTRPAVGEA